MDMQTKGMIAGTVIGLFGLVSLRTWLKMNGWERLVAILLGLLMATLVILARPEEYLQPHVASDVAWTTTVPEYTRALTPIIVAFAVSAVLMFIKPTRALATGFWIGMGCLLTVNLAVTIQAGGF